MVSMGVHRLSLKLKDCSLASISSSGAKDSVDQQLCHVRMCTSQVTVTFNITTICSLW